ncbi:MAG: NGG1p interacting factor NIF3 [Firmicutes bacterium]|nr:NGG1p interacting factor NIF3 [Bacillota bacterium]
MKIKDIYEYVIARGMEKDPRGAQSVAEQLERERERYADLKEEDQKDYDSERLANPYSDTRILYGDPATEVRRLLAGIDIEVGEVLLADRLGEKGQPVDLIMSHHPEGKAMAALHDVMHLKEDILARYGVPINVAEGMMAARISEVKRAFMPVNHNRTVDAARLMGIPLMSAHTVADNQVTTFLQELMDREEPKTLQDVVKLLKTIPEYAESVRHNASPSIVVGAKERRTGKVWVDMTGGTSGSHNIYAKLAEAGVGTMLVMHISEKHMNEAKKNYVNVIIAGHMASDSLGVNLLLDGIEKQGVEIIPCAGLIRHKR